MLILLITLVKEVLRLFIAKNSPKQYVSVEAYLADRGIGSDSISITVSVEHSSDNKASSERYIYVQAYLEKHGLGADAISISSIE